MSRSPKAKTAQARINITLDVDTHSNHLAKELPMKCLFLGEFDASQASVPLRERERLRVDGARLNQCLKKISPTLSIPIPSHSSGEEERVLLTFQSMQDFHPDNIVSQSPLLKRWVLMRHLLKDLKACVMDRPEFKTVFNEIVQQPERREQLTQQLQTLAPLPKGEV